MCTLFGMEVNYRMHWTIKAVDLLYLAVTRTPISPISVGYYLDFFYHQEYHFLPSTVFHVP